MLSHFIEIAEHFKTLLIESCDAIAIAQNIGNENGLFTIVPNIC